MYREAIDENNKLLFWKTMSNNKCDNKPIINLTLPSKKSGLLYWKINSQPRIIFKFLGNFLRFVGKYASKGLKLKSVFPSWILFFFNWVDTYDVRIQVYWECTNTTLPSIDNLFDFPLKNTAIFRLSGWKKNIIFIEFFQTKNLITDSIKFTFEFGESNLMMATPSLTS